MFLSFFFFKMVGSGWPALVGDSSLVARKKKSHPGKISGQKKFFLAFPESSAASPSPPVDFFF
jgi:hypothetical protein